MTKDDAKELEQVAEAEAVVETEAVEEAKTDEASQAASPKKVEAPQAESSKKDKTAKKDAARKEKMKAALAELKAQRQTALEAGDKVQLKRIRGRYKKANRQLRRSVTSKA